MIQFQKVGVAVSFSPTTEAMLAEAGRLARLFGARLVVMHVGETTDESRDRLRQQLSHTGLAESEISLCWETGDPAKRILDVCRRERVDLLVAGALKKENLITYYVGSVARKILRRARCSVLVLTTPGVEARAWKNLVVHAEDSPFVADALQVACRLAQHHPGAWVHVTREIKMLGLTLAAAGQSTEDEYNQTLQHLMKDEVAEVEKMLQQIPHAGVRINIKVLTGKSGYELGRFAERKQADLLIVGAPPRRMAFLDRVFPHDLEYIFADLPGNLLIVQRPNPARP
jgi:nucleotide-binding universal stress UspA family protein